MLETYTPGGERPRFLSGDHIDTISG